MGFSDALKKLAGEAVNMAGNVAEAAAGIVDDVTDEANELFSKAEQKVTEAVAAHSSAEKKTPPMQTTHNKTFPH
ncbi:MAG: hypothetical protein IJC75_05515 [Oscillospiraceae bacterium]|nr:hypothetical protein [Ruminococcus sp.]MBQ4346578.1 hypothetical protein [Oscillospiraceae bacterium]